MPASKEKSPTRKAITDALNKFGCDVPKAAAELGIATTTLRDRILDDKKLRALFSPNADLHNLTVASLMTRERSDDVPQGELIDAVQLNNLDIIADGLERNGIAPETVDKLKGLGGFEKSAGRFSVGSLDIAQRLVTYSTVALFEKAEHIDKTYLQNKNLNSKDKVTWQRAYNACIDQMFKGYNNILSGTVAMTKLLSDGSGTSNKPGFKPLPEDGKGTSS